MIRNETRESAHLKSRVKDLSVVPNIVSFTPLLAAITPIAKLSKNTATGLYDPVLVRDTESLIANFGDPRIDPEKYVDLYSIMQIVGNGTSCYVAKVNSGDPGVYKFPLLADPTYKDEDKASETKTIPLTQDTSNKRRFYVDGLDNKYIITGLKGYSDEYTGSDGIMILYSDEFLTPGEVIDPPLPTEGEIDFTDKFTWKCTQSDGKFSLEVTLLDDKPSSINTIVAHCSIDPAWGSEYIKVSADPDKETPDNVEYVSVGKSLSFTLTSTDKLEHEYILLNSAIDDLKSKFKSITEYGNLNLEYSYNAEGKLVITITFDNVEPSKVSTLQTALDGILKEPSSGFKVFVIGDKTRASHSLIAYSSMAEDLEFDVYISQTKPYSLNVYYLIVTVRSNGGTNILGSAKIKLENLTTNQGLVNNLNSALGTIVRFALIDQSTEAACPAKDRGANSIVKALLDTYCNDILKNPQPLESAYIVSKPSFHVSMNDYLDALEQYKAKKYAGCLMSDLTAPVSRDTTDTPIEGSDSGVYAPNHEERRALHYNLKQIACERKDCTVVLSTPYCESKDNTTAFTVDDACDWVTSQNKYTDLWEYGSSNTEDYSIQSFYLEIYYSWVKQQCTKIESGLAKSVKVLTAPSNIVINNIMTSYRERGVHYPVAGDQYGTLPDTCEIVMNPKTKADRDSLIQSRINPIYDTGTRGIQIFGNETLNAGYTDLNAAHIARTLVYIRSTIDEYTEKLKFSINSLVLWDTWKNYVTNYILEPLKAINALREYDVKMGTDTTSDEEIANRMIKGNISLIFYQSAEIYDLNYTIYSTATTLEEEGVV